MSVIKEPTQKRLLGRKSLFQIGKDLRPRLDRLIMKDSLLSDQAVFDRNTFKWIGLLEQNWQQIRDEATRINTAEIPSLGEISPDHGRIAADRRWRSFFLTGYGYKRAENCARVPLTSTLIEQIPGLVTAVFSVLEAGCHIPRHYGMTKGMLTYHLPLKVPKDREHCWIQIEDKDGLKVHPWAEGQSLLFDDTYNHEVWNNTTEDRYVLLIQVQRPCRGLARILLKTFLWAVRHSRFVQDIKRHLDNRWDTAAA